MRMKVAVLGASGMLGSMVVHYLSQQSEVQLTATVRTEMLAVTCSERVSGVAWRLFDAGEGTMPGFFDDQEWIVNCIGVIKPYIRDNCAEKVERAVRVNALFPHLLARVAEKCGCRVLQIATDCVYSGVKGGYTEHDAHDPQDVYGKTKSLGEAYSPNVHHLRCSIIGPEPKAKVSLLEWFLAQQKGAHVSGYVNHQWNGITTLQFARLCYGAMQEPIALPHVQHVVPSGATSKCDLLRCFRREYGRDDITVVLTEADTTVDRTLSTTNQELNSTIWAAAGYSGPPSIPQMVGELAAWSGPSEKWRRHHGIG